MSIPLLVASCDDYSDVWRPFFALFWRHWPDCPFPVFLESNCKQFDDARVTTLRLGQDTRWGAMARKAIDLLPGDEVLHFLDDFLLTGRVDTAAILDCVRVFRELDANYLRLRPSPPPNLEVPGFTSVGEIGRGEFYRVSMEVALWKKSTLLELAQDEYSPWDMEREGTLRSNRFGGFYSVKREVIPRLNGIEKGAWMRYSLPVLKEAGLTLDSSRPVMSRRATAIMKTRDRLRITDRIRVHFPRAWAVGRRVKRFLRSRPMRPPGREAH